VLPTPAASIAMCHIGVFALVANVSLLAIFARAGKASATVSYGWKAVVSDDFDCSTFDSGRGKDAALKGTFDPHVA
jgi:hypothetical protein